MAAGDSCEFPKEEIAMRVKKENVQVSEEEKHRILLLPDMDYGEIVLHIKDGRFDEIEVLSRSVMLDR